MSWTIAFCTAEDHSVSAATVPPWSYERAVEAILTGDDRHHVRRGRELLRFVAGSLDGKEDAAFYEHIADDADLAGQVEFGAALLCYAADWLTALHQHLAPARRSLRLAQTRHTTTFLRLYYAS